MRERRQAGFTLIELAAVVVVIALLYGFVLPNLGIGSRRALDGEAEGLRADLELARVRAIATGAPHRIAIDIDRARFHMERFENAPPPTTEARDPREPLDLAAPRPAAGSFEPLPTRHGRVRKFSDGVFVSLVETAEGPADQGTVAVAFWQDGSATPARIRLMNDSGDELELEILPLADSVRVHVVH